MSDKKKQETSQAERDAILKELDDGKSSSSDDNDDDLGIDLAKL